MNIPIPSWLVNILVTLAKNFGLPLLLKLWPGLPKEVVELITAILSFIHGSDNKPEAVRQVKQALTTSATCEGVACRLKKG